jgi:hypothetical protein
MLYLLFSQGNFLLTFLRENNIIPSEKRQTGCESLSLPARGYRGGRQAKAKWRWLKKSFLQRQTYELSLIFFLPSRRSRFDPVPSLYLVKQCLKGNLVFHFCAYLFLCTRIGGAHV